MGLEFNKKTANFFDDIEEELQKSLKIKISFDDMDKDKEETKNKEDIKDN